MKFCKNFYNTKNIFDKFNHMALNEKQIREIIREELQNYKENEINFEEKNLAKKTKIITTNITKTILHWIAIIFLIFYGILFTGIIITKIVEHFLTR